MEDAKYAHWNHLANTKNCKMKMTFRVEIQMKRLV